MNKFDYFGTPPFSGIQVVECKSFVEVGGEDWSDVRSAGRARRRRKKHRQNIKPLYAPIQKFFLIEGKIHCHPDVAAKLYKEIRKRGEA